MIALYAYADAVFRIDNLGAAVSFISCMHHFLVAPWLSSISQLSFLLSLFVPLLYAISY